MWRDSSDGLDLIGFWWNSAQHFAICASLPFNLHNRSPSFANQQDYRFLAVGRFFCSLLLIIKSLADATLSLHHRSMFRLIIKKRAINEIRRVSRKFMNFWPKHVSRRSSRYVGRNHFTHFLVEPKLFVVTREINEIQQILGGRRLQHCVRRESMVLVIHCSHFFVFTKSFHFIFITVILFCFRGWSISSVADRLEIAVIARSKICKLISWRNVRIKFSKLFVECFLRWKNAEGNDSLHHERILPERVSFFEGDVRDSTASWASRWRGEANINHASMVTH